MGNLLSTLESSESMNPRHQGSTPSSPRGLQCILLPSIHGRENPPRDLSILSMNPGHNESTTSSSPTTESSQPSPVDSAPPPPMDAIESIRQMYQGIDPAEQIDPLICFVENQLHKMTTLLAAGSTSSEGWLETIGVAPKFAAKIIDTLSAQVEKFSQSDAVKEMKSLTLKVVEKVGELHWLFIALSVAAFTAVESKGGLCLELQRKILELALDVKPYSEQTSKDREKMLGAICTIVEGGVICHDYFKNRKGAHFRFWSANAAASQLEKTNQQCRKDYGRDEFVFLSHSGAEKNFVRQLHRDLASKNFQSFFDQDNNSLPPAEKFPPLIFNAAETCKVGVVVLSKTFIGSKWPMLELSAFVRAENYKKYATIKLLPIFFNITTEELHGITKDYPEWQSLNVSNETRVEWEYALKEVRSINGLHLGKDRNEMALRDRIVDIISCRITPKFPRQLLDFEPVGIEEQMGKVMEKLAMEGNQPALAVIICGFSGMGKSTLARAVVQSLYQSSRHFKFCRVAIRETTQDRTSYIIELQKDIIYYLGDGKVDFLDDPKDGRDKIREALKNKCSLLFIDNVVDTDYIEDLLPKELPCEQETKLRIIMTSRHKNVKAELYNIKNITCEIHEVEGLSDADSKSLLSKTILQSHVEREARLGEDEEKRMIDEVAAGCKGVPLLLNVFGKHLSVDRKEWSYQEALDVLREGNLDSYRDADLGKKLLSMYHTIKDVNVKEAFLDICAYFHGYKWKLVADIVDYPNLENLHRRALVSESGSGAVIVHDILRLVGMKVPGIKRFSYYNELSDDLEEDNLEDVKGISLVNDNCRLSIQSKQLDAMSKSLRVLRLGDWVTLDGPPCQKAFRNLRYLHVGDITAFPFKDPSKLDNLRVFLNRSKPGMNLSSLPSSLRCIYHKVPLVCGEFAKLPFQNVIAELPEDLHLPASLVHLDLSRCKKLPKDIGQLTALKSLILTGSELKCLPQGFGKLKKLKHMTVEDCHLLKELPHGFGALPALKKLYLVCCLRLKTLSDDFENMSTLEQLTIQYCPELEGSMMDKIVKLQSCSMVDIEGSRRLFEKWEEMQSEIKHSIAVFSGAYLIDKEVEKRAIMVALLNWKCVEVNNTAGQLVERSSLLAGLAEGTSATVALIILPIEMQSHQHEMIQRFVEMARETTKTNGLGVLEIVCARKFVWSDQRYTPTEEEERAEKENIRQILQSLPEISCALSKRVKILTQYRNPANHGDELKFFIGHVVVDMEGRESFEKFEECEISESVVMDEHVSKKYKESQSIIDEEEQSQLQPYNGILNVIKSICYKDEDAAGHSKTRKSIETTKDNGVHHLPAEGQQFSTTFETQHATQLGGHTEPRGSAEHGSHASLQVGASGSSGTPQSSRQGVRRLHTDSGTSTADKRGKKKMCDP